MARRNSTNAAATAEAIEILCHKNYHQSFWIPENGRLGHGRLRVTYATTSNFEDDTLPVVMIFHPMFGGRYCVLPMERLAKENGVRVVCPDRPGMGGSTPVPLSVRMETWLHIVPALCEHLGIKHFHAVSHSAGTMYLLNTLYDQRNGLMGDKPTYAGIMAPWVHTEHSHVAMLNLASKLPNSVLDGWNGLIKFINQSVAPSISWSGGAISSAAEIFKSSSAPDDTETNDMAQLLGTSNDVAKEAERLQMKFFFAEDTTAGNEDAKMCLKMGGAKFWGTCEDYPQFLRDLVKLEHDRKSTDTGQAGLTVRTFFAESDMMIGKAGQKYFEDCWSQDGVPGPIDYQSKELPRTNHETVLVGGEKSALPKIFAEVGKMTR